MIIKEKLRTDLKLEMRICSPRCVKVFVPAVPALGNTKIVPELVMKRFVTSPSGEALIQSHKNTSPESRARTGPVSSAVAHPEPLSTVWHLEEGTPTGAPRRTDPEAKPPPSRGEILPPAQFASCGIAQSFFRFLQDFAAEARWKPKKVKNGKGCTPMAIEEASSITSTME